MFKHFDGWQGIIAKTTVQGPSTRHRVAPVPAIVKSRPGCSSMWSKACVWNVGPVCWGPTSLFSQVSPGVSHLHQWFSDFRFYVGHQVATRYSTKKCYCMKINKNVLKISSVLQSRLSYLGSQDAGAYPSISGHRQGNTLNAFSFKWIAKATFRFFSTVLCCLSTLTHLKCLNHFAACAENITDTQWNETERPDIKSSLPSFVNGFWLWGYVT